MRTPFCVASKVAEGAGRWIRERGPIEPAGRPVDHPDVIDVAHDVWALIRGPASPRSRHGAERHRVRLAAASQNDAVDLPVSEHRSEAAAAVAPAPAGPERQLVERV